MIGRTLLCLGLAVFTACGSKAEGTCEKDADCKPGDACKSGKCTATGASSGSAAAATTSSPSAAPAASAAPAPSETAAAPSAAPSASADAAAVDPDAAMNITVEEGWVGTERYVRKFTFRRDPGMLDLTFLAAEAKCQERKLDVCTSTQFERACETDPHAGDAPLWTATADGSNLVVRGGGGCAAKSSADPYQTDPKRAFACCSRVIALTIDKPEGSFLEMAHQHMMDLEGGMRADSPPLARHLSPKVDYQGKKIGSDELVVKLEAARGTGYWLIHDVCKVAPVDDDTWTAECTKLAPAQKGLGMTTTRYTWLIKDSAVKEITDL